ncbi:potassium channel family protein [Patescibacteria group bacterium]|nr:potassium channel family protein [Patescibacteria group bacterium]
MDFQDAIQKIEERGDFNRYAEVKPAFEKRLEELRPGDHTERGICYYYLLISYLKASLVHETEESMEYYKKMDEAFLKQRDVYNEDKEKVYSSELADFYRLMERCYGSLELLYKKKHFLQSKEDAFRRKMQFRSCDFYEHKKIGKWLEYKFLEITSNYGTSLTRWALTVLAFSLVMSLGYFLLDLTVAESLRTIPATGHWFDYIYYAMITLTTVGYGDIVPIMFAAKALAVTESFFGFLMLGIFIGLIQKKI